MGKNTASANSKREQAQAMVANQQKKAKRTRLITIGVAAAAALAIAVPTAVVLSGEAKQRAELEAAASQPIEGVQVYTDLASNHVQTDVDYPQRPGVGGDHYPVWANCGIYNREIDETHAVHSLEHGAVWITYRSDISAEEKAALEELVGERTYLLLSPFNDQEEPIKLSAWGVQLAVDTASDPRIPTFIAKYRQGEQTPEPGAACTGGLDG
ncbi:membrane protein [Zafaria cholistanensis]|uniref:Membrane protein n=1 Tax=Zafaria cholistanensis TaxID=1682741 RepID=A0A5A7NS14_9MICC|nr:DUF3105 domain-containing protein [Zafaria cholistanensis]GER23623.1 membrane protein [Zafaria cholistanensis]